MMDRLPSLTALRAFDAAARHLSFTQAAAELFVTPAAISHQIKTLEGDLDAPLFVRHTRSLSLTEAGRLLAPVAHDAFRSLATAAQQVRRLGKEQPLTVSVAPSFGAKWLIPRLNRFRRHWPGTDIRIDASPALLDYAEAGIDIGIRYGTGKYPGLVAERLLDDEVFPVCSPELLADGPALDVPADLAGHVLLHDDMAQWLDPAVPDWANWLAAAGVADNDPVRSEFFSQSSFAYQAAIEGQGVLLAKSALVGDDLAAGRLVRLFDVALPVTYAYYLVYPRTALADERIAAFRSWVLDEVAAGRDNGAT
jgi:LysR family glycine cleavage system transcriptional activator